MRDLQDIRMDINRVDAALKDLFLERMQYVRQVMEYKRATGTPVKNHGREAEILRAKLEGVQEFREEARAFFKSMIEISCKYQEEQLAQPAGPAVAFREISDADFYKSVHCVCHQGIEGSYSHEMAVKHFPDREIRGVQTFREVFEHVLDGSCQVGILPLENLSAGGVLEVYDLLDEYEVYITHCSALAIDHCLLGSGTLEEVRTVRSHPQALRQCSAFIEAQGYKTEQAANTAVAAQSAAAERDPSVGVICSKINAGIYGLHVLKEHIANLAGNQTKFIFISKTPLLVGRPNIISTVFTLPHQVGSLSRVLNDFSMHGLNMCKIESRPSRDEQWKYVFYVDIEGSLRNEGIRRYLSDIRYMFEEFRILGNFSLTE